MGKVINLNRARKAKARREEAARAEENRIRHGQTRADRDLNEREREALERQIDGARRDEAPVTSVDPAAPSKPSAEDE